MASSSSRHTSADAALISLTGALAGALVTVAAPVVVIRPNRVLAGDARTAFEAFGSPGTAVVAAWIVAALLLLLPRVMPRAARWAGLAAGTLAAASVPALLAAASALGASKAAGDLTRVSLAWGFWVALFAAYVVVFGVSRMPEGSPGGAVPGLAGLVAVFALLVSGRLSGLSLMVEFANAREAFWDNFWQHVAYTLGTTGVALALGVALGVLAAKRSAAESAIFGVLNVAQVMPALAFVALLIVPMGWLGENVAVAGALGVSGIGWAPVFVVLLFYALYPITRNTYTAMRTLDRGIIDAARGVGMSPAQRVIGVELPLALPVVLAGVRIALVQTAAGAIIAALVGGGGLGRIVFYGVEQTASDLVLLGVVPIVSLALGFDVVLRWLGGVFERFGGLVADQIEGAVA